mgnify:CR=1 FL=1
MSYLAFAYFKRILLQKLVWLAGHNIINLPLIHCTLVDRE